MTNIVFREKSNYVVCRLVNQDFFKKNTRTKSN